MKTQSKRSVKLEAVLESLYPIAILGPPNPAFRGISGDSRKVGEGFAFVAVPGQQLNGAAFVDEAARRGAVVVVGEVEFTVSAAFSRTSEWIYPGVTYVQVNDARRALAQLACSFYEEPSRKLDVIGVTGTNGKTTVTFMIRRILQVAGRNPGLIGTIRYSVGGREIPAGRTTPESVELQSLLDQMVRAGCDSAVMEVSSHALDQKRVWGTAFAARVFTNLSTEHLDYHGTLDNYFAAKATLFREAESANGDPLAVINLDDPRGEELVHIAKAAGRVVTFGVSSRADVVAERIETTADGSTFRARGPWGAVNVRLKLPGRFNIANALAALGCCGAMGLDPARMVEALEGLDAVPGRLERIPNGRGIHVFVDYAHTSDALVSVLTALQEMGPRRIIVVFGCGGERDRTKRPLMAQAAARYADVVVVTNDNPRGEEPDRIIEDITGGFPHGVAFDIVPDRKEAIALALERAEKGDMVLVAGKGHENVQEIRKTAIPFDDREVVKELLEGA